MDDYVIAVLMRDLVAHDRRPVSFLVYLWLAREQQRGARAVQVSYREMAESVGVSKSSAQAAVNWLVRRKLVARIRAAEWETQDYWQRRITGYLNGTLHPQQSLTPRVLYVALDGVATVGFIAGHLTRRSGCDGELEWINVVPDHRGTGIAAVLLRLLATWFQQHNALRVCVDPDEQARAFYSRHGAIALNKHWMVWTDISKLAASAPD